MAISTIGASGLNSAVSQIGKNLIQNGAMTLNQRGSAVGAANHFALDRWYWVQSSGDACTKSQDTSVVPAGSGFKFSHKTDVTTAGGAPGGGDFNITEQRIEAQNLQQLLYGVAGAKTLVASFWFRSPKSGTHCVALYQPDGSRSYVREFTVAAADTYEYFTMTFPGDTGGTINNDSGAGLHLVFPMNVGSNFQVAANQWAAGQDYATSNQQNLLDNTANNIYITGVQLEVGSVATDFEHEPISVTLAKCLRYFWRWKIQDANSQLFAAPTMNAAVNAFFGPVNMPVEMRSSPTGSISNVGHVVVADGGNGNRAVSDVTFHPNKNAATIHFTVASGTLGGAYAYRDGPADALFFDFTAEL